MGNAPRIIKKKKNGSVDKSLERREKTQAAKYQTESRKGRREKKKKAKKSLEYRWKTLFFSPAFSNYTKEMPTPIVHPIFNLARCTHTHTRIHKRTEVELVPRYSSMKIETRRANFLTRENYPRETSY